MDIFSFSFFRGIFVLGFLFLKEVSSQEFPIVHIDPAHLSTILEDEQMLRDLTKALSEVNPLLLQTMPEREFYQLHHPNAAVHSLSANNPPKKKDTRHSSRNTRPDFAKPTIVKISDSRPQSSYLFPPLKDLEPKFPSPQITYGFVPRVQKTERNPPKRENKDLNKFQTRNLSARRSNSELPNLKLQKIEQSGRREHETKNKQISALRNGQSQFLSRDQDHRSNWDDGHQLFTESKQDGYVFHGKPYNSAERGHESVRRPTTLIGNPQVSFVHNRKESGHHKQEYLELPSRQNKNANKKFSNAGPTRRPLSFVKLAMAVNLRDTPAYKVNDANETQLDQPVALYRNPEPNSQLGEMEKKRYLVFKTTTMVTTRRPSSAPFTSSSFFRNVPQSSPRDVTVLPPKYSPQVSAVLPLKPSATPAMKPASSAHTAEGKTVTTSSYSTEYQNDFQVTDLKESKTLWPYIGHPNRDFHYEEGPFRGVTEVYSQDSFELQAPRNSSIHPISSPSSASYAVHQNNDGKSQWKKPEAKKSSSKKSFAKTKSKDTEDTDEDDNSGVPGQPGTDYPNYYEIPQTNFDCKEFYTPGFFADVEAGCQVFHNCDTDLQKHSFLCPNGTVFRQELSICDWWYNVRCEDSLDHFPLNDDPYVQP